MMQGKIYLAVLGKSRRLYGHGTSVSAARLAAMRKAMMEGHEHQPSDFDVLEPRADGTFKAV